MSTTKKDTKGQEEELTRMNVILKSNNHVNLDSVTKDIMNKANDHSINISGIKYIPTKNLSITVRRAPCGSGTATFDRFDMKIHTRKLTIFCKPEDVKLLVENKIKPGVSINIKVYND